ncbi:hypothetical protein D1872_346940 [compost metagenome]
MQLAQLVVIQLQPRCAGDLDATVDDRQRAALDHLFIRLQPGVTGIIEVWALKRHNVT